MRICILTQPLKVNYGGILQAYALQATLRKLGHQAWTEDRLEDSATLNRSLYLRMKNFFYFLIKSGKFVFTNSAGYRPTTHQFIKSHIRLTAISQSHTKEMFSQYGFEAYIVGSDQVWRPLYSPFLFNYFLDFTKDDNVKRIAYAASFGSDEWEFTPEETAYCASLLKKFNAVSVREKTAVQLCKTHLGVDAIQTLDPTLLLTKEDYLSLIPKKSIRNCPKYCMAYFLDVNTDKYNIIRDISEHLQCKGKTITISPTPPPKAWDFIKNHYYLSVENWLNQFNQASFVITDSFHGCVFALLFNKPFVAIDSKRRGSARFQSILGLFDLQDRLINSYDDFLRKKTELLTPIDYNHVNAVLAIKRAESISFLECALKPSV